MDLITNARIGKLSALNYCPTCGAGLQIASGQPGEMNAFFICGSHFSTEIGRAINVEVPCPRPSIVAASHLEEEIMTALASVQLEAELHGL